MNGTKYIYTKHEDIQDSYRNIITLQCNEWIELKRNISQSALIIYNLIFELCTHTAIGSISASAKSGTKYLWCTLLKQGYDLK